VSPKHLRESLDAVIESCVNTVGVDLNTASIPLLRHVSGLNQLVARDLVEYRKNNGPFQTRDQLLQVPGIGETRFVQSAGFLKIIGGVNPLDRTWIHPESYPIARQLLNELGYGPEALEEREKVTELQEKLKAISPEEVANRLQIGVPTVKDILTALARPGRDPREDLPPPIFKKGILKLEDLQPAMELKGTVLNVVDFGAFIDIGLKDSGLVHISQMANRYVKSPYDVAAVGDVVTVWVLAVDKDRRRVSLTMIAPGTERKPPEKKPAPPPRREPAPSNRPPQGQGQGQPQHQGQGRGGPPPGGRRPPPRPNAPLARPGSRPPQRSNQPAPARSAEGANEGAQAATAQQSRQPPPPPPPPPRKPKRQPPKPKLSQAALAGKESLGTFAELAAFWDAKKTDDAPAAQPAAEVQAQTEPTPAPEPAPVAEVDHQNQPPV
jgi:protein Tex